MKNKHNNTNYRGRANYRKPWYNGRGRGANNYQNYSNQNKQSFEILITHYKHKYHYQIHVFRRQRVAIATHNRTQVITII